MASRKFWIIAGISAVVLTGGIVTAVKLSNKRKRKKETEAKEKDNQKELENIQEKLESQTSDSKKGDMITPVRDINRALSNSFKDIYGVKLYPSRKSNDPSIGHPDAVGYTNLRTSAEVNNTSAWYDTSNNYLGKVGTGQVIGTVGNEKYDNLEPSIRWFLVKLNKPVKDAYGYMWKYAWVRGDNVTFKPFKKGGASSFDGSDILDKKMVEKYDNTYQLGAQVFPHSDWMLPNNCSSLGGSYDIDDVMDGM